MNVVQRLSYGPAPVLHLGHILVRRAKLFLRQLPVTTDPGARLLEVVARLGGATSHATPSFTSARLRKPRFQPLRGSPQLRACPQQRHPMLTGNG
jgi:hypothetical protein